MNKIIAPSQLTPELKLHDSIMTILFKHKREIAKGLRDIKGIHNIDHVAIIIINPNREISIFSLAPSVEYNLIVNDLWKLDNTFNPNSLENHSLTWWENAYHPSSINKLRQIKEDAHKFTFGLNLVQKIEEFTLIFSFATRSNIKNLKEYYLNLKDELFRIGAYGYKHIRDIYMQYSEPFIAPMLNSDNNLNVRKPYLKLIINNNINN